MLSDWAEQESVGLTDGRILLGRLIEKMREERIVIPGISVVERLATSAMHAADGMMVTKVCSLLDEVIVTNWIRCLSSRHMPARQGYPGSASRLPGSERGR